MIVEIFDHLNCTSCIRAGNLHFDMLIRCVLAPLSDIVGVFIPAICFLGCNSCKYGLPKHSVRATNKITLQLTQNKVTVCANPSLDCGESLLDRVKIWRVRRQKKQPHSTASIYISKIMSRGRESTNRASIIARSSSDLWMLALSMTTTELRPGNGLMLSRSPSMKPLKVTAV